MLTLHVGTLEEATMDDRPPTVDARNMRGEPMSSGAVVLIDDRNGDQALRLLHDAYHALGRGYYDPGQQYGATYQAIADFLYPDVVDVVEPPPETRTFVLPGIGHCVECGAVVTEHEAIVAHDPRAAVVGVAMRPVLNPGTNRPCGHQAQYIVVPEASAIEAS